MNDKTIHQVLLTTIFVLAAAGFTLAHEVVISDKAKLGNGPELQPGTYQIELIKNQDTSEAAFYKAGDLVIRVPVMIVAESEKSRQTEVHYETLDQGRVINQIRVAGWKETLVFRAQPKTSATE